MLEAQAKVARLEKAGAGAAADLDAAENVLAAATEEADKAVVKCLAAGSCFAARTPMRTPNGARMIEEFRPGDLILSRPESDPDGPIVAKVVEAVFVRLGRILNLHVGGEVIRTTAEHPFWAYNHGWVRAGQLGVGDMLISDDGQVMLVGDVLDTGEYETVYNLRVADYHTYFVGSREWGFSVWAHNAVCAEEVRLALEAQGVKIPMGDARLQQIADYLNAGNRNAAKDIIRAAGASQSKAVQALDELELTSNVNARAAAPAARAAVPDSVIAARPTVPEPTVREIARHVVEDPHPQATAPRYPGQTQDQVAARIRAVIQNARGADVHAAQDGSLIFHEGGDTLIVRPEGEGTMVPDPNRATFRQWTRENP